MASKVRHLPDPFSLVSRYLTGGATIESQFNSVESIDTFDEAVRTVGITNRYCQYLLHRPFAQSFWNCHAVLPLVTAETGPVLDYGGGWGHTAQLLKIATSRPIFSLEVDFKPLYFTKRYLEPETKGVIIERGNDLPFSEDAFKTLIDLDGFHYVHNKNGTASEYERVTRADGSILLLHTHNSNINERANFGAPLRASEYAECFSRETIGVPERDFLTDFVTASDTYTASDTSVSETQEFNFFIGHDEVSIDWTDHPLSNPSGEFTLNPLYEKSANGITRGTVLPAFAREFDLSMEATNEYYSRDEIHDRARELLYKGVLTTLPPTYTSSDRRISI
ncbi:methyltransferase domain-containing protein [Halorussus ruber]|uniref:methyltransferase domain-containing protein n=1 Tax=Halorussus ruber TaxID=1126238 RepID=UPI00143DC664|nr:methyltransferase domain-containing protein [Halorussus ruber]